MELRGASAAGILYSSAADIPAKSSKVTLRICSWNVNEGDFHDAGVSPAISAADVVTQLVRTAAIDLLVLQELPMDESGGSGIAEAVTRNSDLRNLSTTILSAGYLGSTHSGICFLSRFPLTGFKFVPLPNPRLRRDEGWKSFDKGLAVHELAVGERVIAVVAVHGFPFHRFDRSASDPAFSGIWDRVAEAVDNVADCRYSVVVGDFNTSNRALVTARTKRRYFSVMNRTVTHDGFAADDILLNENVWLVGGPFAVSGFSDHLAILADVAMA